VNFLFYRELIFYNFIEKFPRHIFESILEGSYQIKLTPDVFPEGKAEIEFVNTQPFTNYATTSINISYAKKFSNSIYGGINLKMISESTSDTKASSVAIDAGIQYITGKDEQINFGVSLKNVGPNMQFSGDGLSFRGFVPGQSNAMTVEQRSAGFELPSLIRIAGSYRFDLGDNMQFIPSYTFTSNSFTNDIHSIGAHFKWGQFLEIRAGYGYENGILDDATRITASTGFAAGISIGAPFKKGEEGGFSIDYAFQTRSVVLSMYSCPEGEGWHLTSG